MHKTGDQYYCPVIGCNKKCKSHITMKTHYSVDGPHQVEEMLEQGLPVWFYRKKTKHMVLDTLEWLLERGYVQHKEPKKRAKVEAAYEEESEEEDLF